jgi:hypothetical protein
MERRKTLLTVWGIQRVHHYRTCILDLPDGIETEDIERLGEQKVNDMLERLTDPPDWEQDTLEPIVPEWVVTFEGDLQGEDGVVNVRLFKDSSGNLEMEVQHDHARRTCDD